MNDVRDTSVEHIAEQAAAWFTRHREGPLSGPDQKQFAQWLAESPVHINEYLAVSEIYGALQGVQPWPEESADELLEQLRATQSGNVVALKETDLGGRAGESGSKRFARFHRSRAWWAVAASAVLIALSSVWLWTGRSDASYRTARGEQRSVVLEDGSVVQLNTLTRMTVRFDERQRRIELPDGEAFFRVASDSNRPFEVQTPFARVRAIGTEFNVYNRPEGTRVTVLEGRVQVASATDVSRKPIALEARQAAEVGVADEVGPRIRTRSSLTAEPDTAWIQRRIVLDDTPLAAAVAEFNRYNKRQMRVEDPRLQALRISGVFSADDPAALMKYLETVQDVRIRPESEGFVLQGAR